MLYKSIQSKLVIDVDFNIISSNSRLTKKTSLLA